MRRLIYLLLIIFLLISINNCSTESTPVYQLTTSAEPSEAGTVTPESAEAEEGDSIQITANVNEHWVFDRWSGDYSGTENPASILMDVDKNVTALFVKQEYPLTIEVEGEGKVSQRVIQQKSTDYPHGTLVELKPVPSEGWEFKSWSGDITSSDEVIEVTVDGGMNVTVTFERIDYPLTITIEGEGTVEQEVVQSKTTEYPFETVVQLTPIPSEGWRFVEWGGDLSGDEVPITITITEEKNVTVTFEPLFYLHTNGITIMCPYTSAGDEGFIEGVEYKSVDRELLIELMEQGINLTRVCTSLITDMSYLFNEQPIFYHQEIGNWDVSKVTDMRHMFNNFPFNKPIGYWDVSNVTNMGHMFRGTQFNQPIGDWDVSSVKDMNEMFRGTPFNQPIENWDVSSVTNMSHMFRGTQFNQPIGDWDVSSVKDMNEMFRETHFNQPIGNWDVSSVTNMRGMFNRTSFNKEIGKWNVESVTNMARMFEGSAFNQPIGNWDVSNVTDMSWMFHSSPFNQPLENWDVSNVKTMRSMFLNTPFNQPIGNWDVGSVTTMRSMFSNSRIWTEEVSKYNQPIGNWDVSSVTDMAFMFSNSLFNQPIGDWEVNMVTNMDNMFRFTPFNQKINNWCVFRIESEPYHFSSNLSPENKPVWGTCPE